MAIDISDAGERSIKTVEVTVSDHMTKSEFQDRIDTEFDDRGIYLVYSYARDEKAYYLQYIGKSIDLPDRVTERHEHYKDWVKAAGGKAEDIRFSIVSLPKYTNLLHCEAALIFALNPPLNKSNTKTYDWDDMKVKFAGRKVCKKDSIIARRTLKSGD